MAADIITYANKSSAAGLGTPERTMRDTDANEIKSVVNQHATEIDSKVDKVVGKELSDNNFTDVEKTKLTEQLPFFVGRLVEVAGVVGIIESESSGISTVTIVNNGTGDISIKSTSFQVNRTVCVLSLSDYARYKVTYTEGDVQIEVTDLSATPTNAPLDGAAVIIKVIEL